MTDNSFEIPQAMRDLTEQNIEPMGDTMDASMRAIPSPTRDGFKDVRERAMDFATDNAESAFAFAARICNAKTPEEILTLQSGFTQDRVNAVITQTQELRRLVEQAKGHLD